MKEIWEQAHGPVIFHNMQSLSKLSSTSQEVKLEILFLELHASDRLPACPWGLRDMMEWQRKWSKTGGIHRWVTLAVGGVWCSRQGSRQSALQMLVLIGDIPGLIVSQVHMWAWGGGLCPEQGVGGKISKWTYLSTCFPRSSPQSSFHYPSTNSCSRKNGLRVKITDNQKRSHGASAKAQGKSINKC